MLSFDLKTPVIPEGQKLYILHPGKSYHLFEAFKATQSVAADLPNLELPDGLSPLSADDIDTQIVRARALRDWLSLNSEERKRQEFSLDIDIYKDAPSRRFHDSYKETLDEILWGLDATTRIFVPSPFLDRDGFFCELEPARRKRVKFEGPRSARNFFYTGRPVSNIRNVPMRLIPPEILEEKSRNSVLTELDFQKTERMLRLYYGSFSIENSLTQTEIVIPQEIFRPADANVVNALANLLEENLQRLDKGATEAADFYDALFLAFDESGLQIHARLNSKGVHQVAARTIAPFLLSFFIGLPSDLSAEDAASQIVAHEVEVTNSECPDDEDYPRLIEERLFGIVDMLGEKEVSNICRRVKEFGSRTNAKVNSEVTED